MADQNPSFRLLPSHEPGLERLLDSLMLADRMFFAVLSTPPAIDVEALLSLVKKYLEHHLHTTLNLHHLKHAAFSKTPEEDHLVRQLMKPLFEEPGTGRHFFVINALGPSITESTAIWARFFRRLNESRNTIMDHLSGPLLLLTSPELAVLFAREAPDFWSVRSAWEEIKSLSSIGDVHLVDLARKLRHGLNLHPGDVLGHYYKLISTIGSGGFATVWKAYDRRRESLVAIKVLHHQFNWDQTKRDRFFRGARKMASLNHPGVVMVYEPQVQDADHFFYTMEYVSGSDLYRFVQKNGPLDVIEAIRLTCEIGDALALAHAQGIIHRDVKPSNILLTPEKHGKLTDFDLVRAADTTGGTRTGAMGTFLFAAPEIMQSPHQAGPQVDVYGLAMTALFLINGSLTYDVLRRPDFIFEKLAIGEGLKNVLKKGISWDCNQRYLSITEFCVALQGNLSPSLSLATSVRPLGLASQWVSLTPGSFQMGSDSSELAWEKPAHQVSLSKEIFISKTPVTNEMFHSFIDAGGYDDAKWWCKEGWHWLHLNELDFEKWYQRHKDADGYFVGSPEHYRPSKFPRFWTNKEFNSRRQPVVGVNWYEAMAFCRWLENALLEESPSWLPKNISVRLLTEAEWEYAARGGTGRRYPWGAESPDTSLANFGATIGRTTRVESYPKGYTPLGLADMAGNAWEWCMDGWDANAYTLRTEQITDPIVQTSDPVHVLRGGSWDDLPLSMRCTARMGLFAATRDKYFGFRCCLETRNPEKAE